MKYRLFMAIALMTGAMGCSMDVLEVDQEESLKIVFEASPFVDGDSDADTRTSVVPNEAYTNYEFIWSAKDTVGIYPDAGSQIFFTMENGAGASSATFDGGAWTCKEGHEYRSYFPFIGNYYLDKTKIPVTFLGQKQVGNGNSDHFQKYDYMYTEATTKDSGFLNFTYSHLITAVLPWVELPAGHYTGLTLSLDEALFVTEGEYDLTAASPAIVGKKYSDSMSIELDVTFTSPDILKVYVPLAPMDMSGKTLTITITNENGGEFQYTYKPSKPYAASKIYRLKSATSFVSQNNVIFYTSTDGSVVIPNATDVFGANIVSNEYVNGKGTITFDGDVTSIGNYAFKGRTTLTSISIPENVNSIGTYAFMQCDNLTSVTIPTSVKSIGYYAFYGCSSLTSVTIPTSVKSIGYYAFYGCSSLTSVTIPEGVTSIENSTFRECSSLTTVIIPESITRINNYAFHNCTSLNTINLPTNLASLGYAVFCATALTSITIPESVTSIDEASFSIKTLVSFKGKFASSDGLFLIDSGTVLGAAWGAIDGDVTIPDGITRIGNDTFWGCPNLSGIQLPDGLISIGGAAFRECKKMTNLIIPESVTSIGEYAFDQCSGLTWITVLPINPPTLDQNVFQSTGNCPIYVPAVSVDSYKAADYWRYYADRIQAIPSSVAVTEVSLDLSSLSLTVGTSKTLIATVLPENAANKNVSWSSSDESVATVDAYGNVDGIASGSATITATTEDGGFTATCEVTVNNAFPEGNAFDENAFITYVANHQEWLNISADKTYRYDTYFNASVSGTMVEMKFQVPSYSKKAILTYGSSEGLAIDASNVYYYSDERQHEDGDTWYEREFTRGVENGVDGTGVIVLTASCDGNQVSATINGTETTIPVSISSFAVKYIFSDYDYQSGDGALYAYIAGVPEGSKLYYVKIWDGNDLVYFGHASRSVCPYSSEEEYCWYEEIGNTYTFARDLHTLTSSEVKPYNPVAPIATVRQPFGGGMY